ncbi:hypothetical protein F0562_006577 [Nyssa sinensis]|uniref:Uncharacterized protein n=1 Tax=Nyssa sinensis TaxID=561372 RepID=A0A5J5APQ0_9ASTE|nr:hypothetical protein F0562_006577 [Nyssa sinensis]
MACLDMYNQNSEQKGLCAPPMSPRISFSTDFAESSHSHDQQMIKQERASREAPVSSDFEFSVTNHSMMSADELFFKGRLLPFKDSCNNYQYQKTTLRDELLVDNNDNNISMRPPKGWKEILGLKKTHIGSKKSAKNDGNVE